MVDTILEVICHDDYRQHRKVSHHGSKSSSSEEFIKSISPKLAFISAGVNNRYNHPSAEVVDRLDKMNIPHLCTIECGRLKVNLDDKSVKIYYNLRMGQTGLIV